MDTPVAALPVHTLRYELAPFTDSLAYDMACAFFDFKVVSLKGEVTVNKANAAIRKLEEITNVKFKVIPIFGSPGVQFPEYDHDMEPQMLVIREVDTFPKHLVPQGPNINPSQDEIDVAIAFHNAYEELAPLFGYETRPDTKQFDPRSPNGRLMAAVVEKLRFDGVIMLHGDLR